MMIDIFSPPDSVSQRRQTSLQLRSRGTYSYWLYISGLWPRLLAGSSCQMCSQPEFKKARPGKSNITFDAPKKVRLDTVQGRIGLSTELLEQVLARKKDAQGQCLPSQGCFQRRSRLDHNETARQLCAETETRRFDTQLPGLQHLLP